MSAPVEPSSEKYRLNVKKPTLFTLIVLISYGSIGAALFTPAIPSLMDRFDISASVAQLTVMIYLVGYSLGQLIYSPLAKRYGRKPALYIGIGISLVGTFFCAIAGPLNSFTLLVISRLIASLGASAGLSLTFMIICDYYYEKHARKITAYTMVAFAVIPGIAIAIGGFLVAYLGWESCFYFLLLYGLFTLYLVFRLAETGNGKEKEAIKMRIVFSAYRRDFKNRILVLYSIMIGATTAIIYIFAATAPVIIIGMMGISADKFGLFNLIPAGGYFLGNFVAARFASFLKIKTVLKLGVTFMGIGLLILAILFYGGWVGPLTLFFPMFIVYFGVPLFYSNATVLATFRVPDKPNASSIMSFLNIGGAVVGLIFIELLHSNPIYAMPSVFIVLFVGVILLFKKGQKLIED